MLPITGTRARYPQWPPAPRPKKLMSSCFSQSCDSCQPGHSGRLVPIKQAAWLTIGINYEQQHEQEPEQAQEWGNSPLKLKITWLAKWSGQQTSLESKSSIPNSESSISNSESSIPNSESSIPNSESSIPNLQ
ncbi:hypothetical protein AWZ03_005137 [Drosophila navojoa]|uniref:Uncharacterized protein n=1 Tax=Drosophila navojoa TaxID=7232 RepID=A0A484BJL0_DRONA|nr:hypothetical protein AWZ03_005137 [Drosophila navojoa]